MSSLEKIFDPGPGWREMTNDDIPAQTYIKVVHGDHMQFWIPVEAQS